MKKTIKIVAYLLSSIIILMVSAPVLLSIVLQLESVQQWAITRTTQFLSDKTGATFSIKKIEAEFFNKTHFEDLYIESHAGDTMIYIKNLDVSISSINFFTGKINLSKVTADSSKVYLQRDSLWVMNAKRVFDFLKPSTMTTLAEKPDFKLSIAKLNGIHTDVKLEYWDAEPSNSFNLKDLHITDISFEAEDLEVFNYDISLSMLSLRAKEKSGFTIDNFTSPHIRVNSTGLRFNDLELKTPNSTINANHLNFLYSSWWDYTNFLNLVTLDADIKPSTLSLETIAYFSNSTSLNIPLILSLSGSIYGTIPQLRGDITMSSVGNELSGDFTITGLPDTDNSTFELNLHDFETNQKAISNIINIIGLSTPSPQISRMLDNMDTINAQGKFYGLLSNFHANTYVTTKIGSLEANLQLHPSQKDGVHFIGDISTHNFNVGNMLSLKKMGALTSFATIKGSASSSEIYFSTKATIDTIHWNSYNYRDINMDGLFKNRVFNGSVSSSKDSNLMFKTQGEFNFTNDMLPSYDFVMQLDRANLFALNINKRDSVSLLASNFKAHFSGNNIDNLNGTLVIDSTYYINHLDTITTGVVYLNSYSTPRRKEVSFSSDFADVKLVGASSYRDIFPYLSKMASTYMPAFPVVHNIVTGEIDTSSTKPITIHNNSYDDGYYTLKVDVKKSTNATSAFLPGLEIAEGTVVNFLFNPSRQQFYLDMTSDYIINKNMLIGNLRFNARNISDSISGLFTSSELVLGKYIFPDINIKAGIKDNIITLLAEFLDSTKHNSSFINTTTKVYRTDDGLTQIGVHLHSSDLEFNGSKWHLPPSLVTIDTTGFSFYDFNIGNSSETLSINGKAGSKIQDTLNVKMKTIDLSPLSRFISRLGYDISGYANGHISIVSLFNNPLLYSSIELKDIVLAGYPLSDSEIISKLSDDKSKVLISLKSNADTPISGYYDISNQRYNIDFIIPEFSMPLLNPLYKGVVHSSGGVAYARLNLSGTNKTPSLNGHIKVEDYNMKVAYTNVDYFISGDVVVEDNRFTLNPTIFRDLDGGTGNISAFFDSHYFKNLSYGINTTFTDLLAISTSSENNPHFYGTIYGSGSLDIFGTNAKTNIDITAETAKKSSVILPFTNVSTVEQTSFIEFTDKNSSSTSSINSTTRRDEILNQMVNTTLLKSELDIKLTLNVLPNTNALIEYSNSIMNNTIVGQGSGLLQMHINPFEDIFTLNGSLDIDKGSYRLALSLADKTFTLEPGGQLIWQGDPANPYVNFTGIYQVRTSLEPLTGFVADGSKMTTIDCGITIADNLWNPRITFDIKAPNATPELQNLLHNALNTEEALSMQFISLFISNNFLPTSTQSNIGTMSGSIVSTTGIEFLSNQVGTLLSTKNFNFRPTYRPRSESITEEVGFKASLNIIEDKVMIEAEGNYATTQTNDNQNSPFTAGGNVTVQLNSAGTLSMKGFTRVIDRFNESQGLQESGLGVYFQQDFYDWNDLQNRYKNYLQRIRDNKLKRKEQRDTKK